MASTEFESAIYEGWVHHERVGPRPHEFRYKLFMMYLDLEELPAIMAYMPRWLMGYGFSAVRFKRTDYHGPETLSVAEAVRNTVSRQTGVRPEGPIRMLTHLRYFGYCFNPVTFYYCFRPDGRTLEAIVAEITNTPWKERFSYVLIPTDLEQAPGADAPRKLRFEFPKMFHVSPFMPMDMAYRWTFTAPRDGLLVHMRNLKGGQKRFDATLTLRRRALARSGLVRVLARYPLMTAKVIAGIYVQAFLLWLKKTPSYPNPRTSEKERKHEYLGTEN